jgi:hypothetical protein
MFKRRMKGVYQHPSEKHLRRYVAEFDFRYSNRIALCVGDQGRAEKAILDATAKRLTCRSLIPYKRLRKRRPKNSFPHDSQRRIK